ncbi:Zn(2)-C6 fungal-type domain-containing protein [Fusarium falciforme]|uniref:Zn(2)-C6 fungal-type domain-containing protein n=1 Tax=Fusarium falciforme TaxID=195108 RepID=UPI002300B917|nr:Zn(2)-C6 fungal-type domain-containing protein [Fusarium falciforme]WAO86322.1 Zn(2)-C6 fungal-type domain-containing protein [Fusarium falciforme]
MSVSPAHPGVISRLFRSLPVLRSRKKTKCTAERPICSYCQRLRIQCFYLPRARADGKGRKTNNVGYVDYPVSAGPSAYHQLEACHGDTLSSIVRPDESQLSGIPPQQDYPQDDFQSGVESRKFSTSRPEPTPEALKHFVDVYRTKLHLQPLPLFNVQGLEEQLATGPQFLLWSFMALTMMFSTHPFYEGQESAAVDFYTCTAEERIKSLASEGVLIPELTKSLCLIALKHLKTQQLARAWMTTGTASRLEALRILSCDATSASTDDSISRAHWSTFMLERLFVPWTTDLSGPGVPDFPVSAPTPPPPSFVTVNATPGRTQSGEAPTRNVLSSDPGIIGVHLRLVGIWGKLKLYLFRLRQGATEKPWAPESIQSQLNIELLEHEALIDSKYFLCKAFLPNRTIAEVSRHREYWDPFMASQIIWHSIHAILNHPFIHLFLLRSPKEVPPSCLFLQQKVDMALFHTGWLFRVLQSFMDLMDVVDPMVTEFVAAAATVPWLFQFSNDAKIAQRARDDLQKCDTFLSHAAVTWPHFAQKLGTLRQLQALADENRRQHSNDGTTISFQPAWLWDLLDPRIYSSLTGSPHPSSELASRNLDSKMYLKSHFVMPLHEDQDSGQDNQPASSAIDAVDSLFAMPGDLELFNIESLSHDCLQNGLWDQGY